MQLSELSVNISVASLQDQEVKPIPETCQDSAITTGDSMNLTFAHCQRNRLMRVLFTLIALFVALRFEALKPRGLAFTALQSGV